MQVNHLWGKSYRDILIMVKFGRNKYTSHGPIFMTALLTKVNRVTIVTSIAVVNVVAKLPIIFWSAY